MRISLAWSILCLVYVGTVSVDAFTNHVSSASSFAPRLAPTPVSTSAPVELDLTNFPRRRISNALLFLNRRAQEETSDSLTSLQPGAGPTAWKLGFFATTGALYWYLMVLGAAAHANGLPIPDWLPLTPGWPASEADFAPLIEDSFHFFYLSELLGNTDAPYVIPPRLAVFNLDEAWIFAMLPALWRDGDRRLPRPVLLFSWLVLGINLTNGFLLPYLAITELRSPNVAKPLSDGQVSTLRKNRIVSGGFAAVTSAVIGYALLQCLTVATPDDWSTFMDLIKTDRSYLAFVVDSVVFSLVQPLILQRVKSEAELLDFVPVVGLVSWLLRPDENDAR